MKPKSFFSSLILLIVIAAGIFSLTHFREISDYIRLMGYSPPRQIEQLADETTMKDETRRVFYVNHPQLNDKTTFNEHCRNTEKSIILGCYVSNDGIYLLDVKEPKLDGVIEVTAAHETLHAEYDRISSQEKSKVDNMTANFYSTITDERIKETVENYRKKDPSVVPNELHSILGTEVRNLSPELEKYYSRYFKNREKIVSYSEDYEQAFLNIEAQAKQLENQLLALKSTIEANKQKINAQSEQLSEEKSKMNAYLAAGNRSGYNNLVDDYNQKVASYNSLINQTRTQINQYNELVNDYNELALQQQKLNQAIDSSSIGEKL